MIRYSRLHINVQETSLLQELTKFGQMNVLPFQFDPVSLADYEGCHVPHAAEFICMQGC